MEEQPTMFVDFVVDTGRWYADRKIEECKGVETADHAVIHFGENHVVDGPRRAPEDLVAWCSNNIEVRR